MPKFRQAHAEDIEALCALDDIASHNIERAAFIESAIDQASCWVVEVDASIIGYAVLNYSFFDCGFIQMLYFNVTHRRKGLGLQMMEYLESICRTKKLFTSTNQSNLPAQRLLEKADYTRSGTIENLDDNDPELVYFKSLS